MQGQVVRTFRDLHSEGCFVMPNPWDVGTAKLLASLGFPALATTSSGFAFARGLPDGGVPRDEMLDHIKEIVEATPLPVNADFQYAYADDPEGVASNVRLCVQTGVAGLSVEDMRNDRSLYDFDHAVERVRAAREAIDSAGSGVLLTARCEALVAGHEEPLAEVCGRFEAFSAAGADVLFAPGVGDAGTITTLVEAAAPKPINVIASPRLGSVAAIAELGVRRISLASALARTAWGSLLRAARQLASDGTFDGLRDAEPGPDLNRFFSER